jgi:hypothetical protein
MPGFSLGQIYGPLVGPVGENAVKQVEQVKHGQAPTHGIFDFAPIQDALAAAEALAKVPVVDEVSSVTTELVHDVEDAAEFVIHAAEELGHDVVALLEWLGGHIPLVVIGGVGVVVAVAYASSSKTSVSVTK